MVYHSVKTVRKGVIHQVCTESREQNVSSVIALTKPFITANLHSVVKLTITERSKKQSHYEHYSQTQSGFQYYFHLRTVLINYLFYT